MCVSLSGWSFIKPLISHRTINYRVSVEHDNGGAHTLMNDERKLTLDSDEVSWAHVGGLADDGRAPCRMTLATRDVPDPGRVLSLRVRSSASLSLWAGLPLLHVAGTMEGAAGME